MKQSIANLLLIAVATSLGCSSGDQVPGVIKVSGKVTLDQVPVEGATVTFQPEGQTRSASGITDKNGTYKLTTLNPGDGALPGKYKVLISKVEDTDPAHHMTGLEFTEMITSGKRPPPPPTGSKKKNVGLVYHVPQKYMDAKTTDLTAEVDKSNTTINFELKK